MKYGERFEEASVPSWSLHNIDYNSLKHQIKTHTSKAQATAIAIPGQQDHALQRFEGSFYRELVAQHDRVDLFVTSKADEISRRLRHLSGLFHQLILRCADSRGLSAKRQRKFSKYQWQLDECEHTIHGLSRFVSAQVIAFRKILKKYKKWTGSTTLSNRFKENILSSPKSFTKRDFSPLHQQYRELHATIEAALPFQGSTVTPDLSQRTTTPRSQSPTLPTRPRQASLSKSSRTSSTAAVSYPSLPSIRDEPTAPYGYSHGYWNEYEHGSEAGEDDEGGYAIYIDPDADFLGLVQIKTMFAASAKRVGGWLRGRCQSSDSSQTIVNTCTSSETQSLLNHPNGPNVDSAISPADYFSIQRGNTTATTDNDQTEDDTGYASSSSERFLPFTLRNHDHMKQSQHSHPAKIALYRDTRYVLLAFAASFTLLIVSGVLISTGRRKLRLEVDAGVTVGSVASLFCACMGLGAMLYRQYPTGYCYVLAVWAAFLAVCALNGMLLVLVVGNSGL
ncbi:hypothetical protein F5Y15DRAFT_7655 [Xylariaceae sp. FL0016]|nr:hypothetical protein F5Y15DRAFT_7655 [Xylariaceae sp. FL0016]